MVDLPAIYQRVIEAIGDIAFAQREGEHLLLIIRDGQSGFFYTSNGQKYLNVEDVARIHDADAANAIAVHWLLMLYASYKPADMTAVTRFAPEPPMLKDATIGELIESLAERVIRECKP